MAASDRDAPSPGEPPLPAYAMRLERAGRRQHRFLDCSHAVGAVAAALAAFAIDRTLPP